MPAIGEKAPEIILPGTDGTELQLSTLGGPALIFFYPKDDTPGCTVEAIDFSNLKDDFSALNITLIGISPDSLKKHDKFRAKHNLTVLLAADEEKRTLEAYGVWVMKKMYGREYMGVERSTFLIDGSGVIRQIWRKVKVKNHAQIVMEEARTLLASIDPT